MKMHPLLALLLTIQSSFATSFYIRPFSEFTKTTSNIVHGKISGVHSENGVTSDGGRTIYTYAKLEIQEVLKGTITGSQIIVRKLGGSKDGVTLEIPSSVEFFEHEDSVFFLSAEQEDRSYEVTGMELGKFTLEEKNGEQILKGGLFSYSKPPAETSPERHVESGNLAENQKPWSITQLKEMIRSQAQSPQLVTLTENKKITNDSSKLTNKNDTPSSLSNTQTEQSPTSILEKENSPLYFGSAFWYSLATIVLTLGVYLYFRRR